MGEFEYIRWLREQTRGHSRVLVGPGDDTAVLAPFSQPVLVTTDMLMDGTDFLIEEVGPRAAGRKSLAANLSDIAAMAGVPVAAVVSVALPQLSGSLEFSQELFRGIRELADQFQTAIVGGDTNSWRGPFAISITLLGEATSLGAVRRSAALPGDWIFVTGSLGGSILGHHLNFTPRVQEALRLQEFVRLHAMIDVSDGLAADLNHILEESGCGAVLDAHAIPISDAAHELSRTSGKPPLQHALGDGEDFELVFTVSAADGAKLLSHSPLPGVALTKIGECIGAGLWIDVKGERQPLEPTGWVHQL